MKINKIRIDGFGAHAGREWAFGDGNITVFFGRNERGKTTLARFIDFALYGRQALSGGRDDNTYEPAAGGAQGGTMEFDSNGERYTLTRHIKGKKDKAEIRDANHAPVDAAVFERDLRHGTTWQNFATVFSMDIDELASAKDSKNKDSLGEIFYDSLGGAGGVSPKSALQNIQKQLEALYSPGTRKTKNLSDLRIGATLARLEALDREIAAAKRDSDNYATLAAKRSRIADDIAAKAREIADLSNEIRTKEALLALENKYADYLAAKTALEQFPASDGFPESGLWDLKRLNESIGKLSGELVEKKSELEQKQCELDGAAFDPTYIERENDVAAMFEKAAAFRKEAEHREELERTLRERAAQIESELNAYLPGWTRERVEATVTGIVAEDELKAATDRMAAAADAASERESEIAAARKDIERLNTEIEAQESEKKTHEPVHGRLTPDEFKSELAAWIEYDRKLAEWKTKLERLRETVSQKQQTIEGIRSVTAAAAPDRARSIPAKANMPLLASGVAIALLGLILLFVKIIPSVPWIGYVAGSFLIACGAAFIYSSLPEKKSIGAPVGRPDTVISENQKQIDELEIEIKTAEEQIALCGGHLKRILEALGQDSLTQDGAAELRARFETQQALFNKIDMDIKKKRAELESRMQYIGSDTLAADNVREEIDAAERNFIEVKQKLSIPEGVSAEAAREILRRAAGLKEKYRECDALAASIDAKKSVAADFEGAARALAASLGERAPDTADAPTLIKIIHDKLAAQKEMRTLADRLRGDIARLEEDKQRLTKELADTREALEKLLADGGAPGDPDLFRKNAETHEARRAAKDALAVRRAALLAGKPDGEDEETFLRSLAAIHPAGWQDIREETSGLAARKKTAEADRETLIREEENVKNEIETLLSDDKLRLLEQDFAANQQVLLEQARRWDILSAAEKIMERLAEEDEKKRMPDVKRFASELFSRFTGGAFDGVYIASAEKTVSGIRAGAGAAHTTPALMSRSVRQELYLALRLAQALHLGAGADGQPGMRETMPVIMDDVLVDIDDDRLPRVVQALRDTFGGTKTQLIYFTAHEHIRRAFEDACGKDAVVDV